MRTALMVSAVLLVSSVALGATKPQQPPTPPPDPTISEIVSKLIAEIREIRTAAMPKDLTAAAAAEETRHRQGRIDQAIASVRGAPGALECTIEDVVEPSSLGAKEEGKLVAITGVPIPQRPEEVRRNQSRLKQLRAELARTKSPADKRSIGQEIKELESPPTVKGYVYGDRETLLKWKKGERRKMKASVQWVRVEYAPVTEYKQEPMIESIDAVILKYDGDIK